MNKNIKRVDAKEIITQSAKSSGSDADKEYAALSYLVQTNPNFRVIRANNSLFTIQNMGNGQAKIHLDTIDSPKDLIDSIRDFIGSMKKAGFERGVFDIENGQILKAIKMAGGQALSTVDESGNRVGMVEF